MCAPSPIAVGSQSIAEFGAAKLGVEFADAEYNDAPEVCDGGGPRFADCFQPGEGAAKVAQLMESGKMFREWWSLRCHGLRKDYAMRTRILRLWSSISDATTGWVFDQS